MQTLPYRAPEAALGLPIGPPIDLWSVGVLLAEVALRRPLLPCRSPLELLAAMAAQLGPLPAGMVGAAPLGRRADLRPLYASAAAPAPPPRTQQRPPALTAVLQQQAAAGPARGGSGGGGAAMAELTVAENADGGRGGMDAPPLLQELMHVDAALADLVLGLLSYDPHRRLTAQQALLHPFLQLLCPLRAMFPHLQVAVTGPGACGEAAAAAAVEPASPAQQQQQQQQRRHRRQQHAELGHQQRTQRQPPQPPTQQQQQAPRSAKKALKREQWALDSTTVPQRSHQEQQQEPQLGSGRSTATNAGMQPRAPAPPLLQQALPQVLPPQALPAASVVHSVLGIADGVKAPAAAARPAPKHVAPARSAAAAVAPQGRPSAGRSKPPHSTLAKPRHRLSPTASSEGEEERRPRPANAPAIARKRQSPLQRLPAPPAPAHEPMSSSLGPVEACQQQQQRAAPALGPSTIPQLSCAVEDAPYVPSHAIQACRLANLNAMLDELLLLPGGTHGYEGELWAPAIARSARQQTQSPAAPWNAAPHLLLRRPPTPCRRLRGGNR